VYKALSFGLIAGSFFFTTLPAQRTLQQEDADSRSQARRLLQEAFELATQIESADDRSMVFRRIGEASWRFGDKATAAESFDKALKILAMLPQENPYQDRREFERAMIAMIRARLGDIDGAQQTLSLIKSDSERSYALLSIASAQASAKNFADAVRTASAIQDSENRDQALAAIAYEQAEAGDAQGATQQARSIKNAQYKAGALAHIAAVSAKGGHTEEASKGMQEALAAAEKAQPREDEGGRSGLAACTFEEPEEPRDAALAGIVVNQAEAGDAAGALETINHMHDKAGRENALATVAEYQARAGDFDGARASIASIGRDECRTAALHGIVMAQFEAGNLSAALSTVDGMTDAYQKALTLWYLAEQVAKQGAINSESEILARALEVARQITDDNDRVTMLGQIALSQAHAGNRAEAAKTLAEAAPLAIASHERAKMNNEWNSRLQNFAEKQAGIGDLDGAWNTLTHLDRGGRLTVVQSVAQARSRDGDTQSALAWADRQVSHRDKALALVGAAEGILQRIEAEKK
jgi:hypothetical protein